MDVGNGMHVSDKFFTPAEPTGLCDRNGKPLSVADPVKIFGCRATRGFIGKNGHGTYMLYFATTCTVQWYLDERTLRLVERIDDHAE